MNEQIEKFKQLEDYPGYQISTQGRIFRIRDSKEIKPFTNADGYLQVSLPKCNPSAPRYPYVHRLVAKTFLPNSDSDKKIVDHLDNNPLNNCVSNLEWITQRENVRRGLQYRINSNQGIQCVESGVVYNSISDASKQLSIRYYSIYGAVKTGRSIAGKHFKYIV